ncbi:PLP-dependent aminotransferase family protein [Photobacterium sanguinicancri]|uniref:aminotransferase-like domain-containing protein n=1 Tax=Photobacterium sanguinicancri TaxID=875932 RepID=UPI003D0CEC6A
MKIWISPEVSAHFFAFNVYLVKGKDTLQSDKIFMDLSGVTNPLKRYQRVITEIENQITQRIWLPGERIPSIRAMSKQHGISPMTVIRAYEQLEADGLIHAKPKSGYFVSAHLNQISVSQPDKLQTENRSIAINAHVFDVLSACKKPNVIPFGSAFPDPELLPLNALGRAMGQVMKTMSPQMMLTELPPGNMALRRAIAKRYLRDGIDVSVDDIVITSGAMESLGLSLMAVTRPGDSVAIESPAFYGVLQTIERLKLKAIEIPTHPHDGIDVAQLQRAIETHEVKACWVMSSFQNPLGASMPDETKQSLITLLNSHDIPLIEDDVYGELYFSDEKPKPIKAFDQQDRVLHCCSFSKSLAMGFRVGWVVAGQYAQQVERLQLMSTLSAAIPNQLAIANYLQHGNYDTHLRRLRAELELRMTQTLAAIKQYFPEASIVSKPSGGYFLWVELPAVINSANLLPILLEQHNISIAPGTLFASDDRFKHCIRLNCAYEWNSIAQQAIRTIAQVIKDNSH